MANIVSGIMGFVILLVFMWLGGAARQALFLPLPGPVVGFALLALALIALEQGFGRGYESIFGSVGPVARGLLNHMGLLFVPAGVGIINEGEVLQKDWLPILLGVLFSTILGLAATGWFMKLGLRGANENGE